MGELGALLKELRERHRLGLREAARALGISHSRLRDFEIGRSRSGKDAVPPRELIAKLARLYGDYPVATLLAYAGFSVDEPSAPPIPSEAQAQTAELTAIFANLPAAHRRILLDLAHSLKREASSQRP